MTGDAVSEMNPPPSSHKEVPEDTLDLQPQIDVLTGLDLDRQPQIKARLSTQLPAVVRVGGRPSDPAPAIGASSSARKAFIRGQHTWHLDPRQKAINKAMARALRKPLAKRIGPRVDQLALVAEPPRNGTAHLENV